MNNLHNLHDDMVAQNAISTVFTTVYNNHNFSCIFIIGITSHQLYITTVENNPHTILVDIDLEFQAPNSLCHEHYIALANYLGFTPNIENPFKPRNFFEEFDEQIPVQHARSPVVHEMIAVVGSARNVPDEDRIYFIGWRKNPDGSHVSRGNYWKTCSIVGEKAANDLCKNNISSCWSDIPHDEQLHLINQYEDYL